MDLLDQHTHGLASIAAFVGEDGDGECPALAVRDQPDVCPYAIEFAGLVCYLERLLAPVGLRVRVPTEPAWQLILVVLAS